MKPQNELNWWATKSIRLLVDLFTRLNGRDVNCVGGLVVSAGDFDLLFGKRRRFFLIVQLIHGLRRRIK